MKKISMPIAYFVEIRSDMGARLAYGQDLAQTADRPMAVLTRRGNRIIRQNRWPIKNGHVMAFVVLFGCPAYLLVPKMPSVFGKGLVVALALFIILFVGFTRVFTAAHYLTDVLAGYAVGLAWPGVVYTLIELDYKKRRNLHVKKG